MNPDIKNKISLETHPLLPSGEWEGFYCYYNNMQQHKMSTNLRFINSSITGSGTDDIAPFRWSGSYDLKLFKLTTKKVYELALYSAPGPSLDIWNFVDIIVCGLWGGVTVPISGS